MNPQKYLDGLEEKNRLLSAKNKEYKELSVGHAETERQYNIQYAGKLVSLRMDGTPITIAKDLAKGDKVIAGFFFKMKVAEGVVNACRESMKDLRSSIDTYRSILSWLKAEKHETRG